MTCATPGCTFRDFHIGPHSTQLCVSTRDRSSPDYLETWQRRKNVVTPEPKRAKRPYVPVNDFQLGFDFARDIINDSQVGVNLILRTKDIDGFDGWQDFDPNFAATIVTSNYDKRFVATAVETDGTEITLTPTILMLSTTYVKWNPLPAKFYAQWKSTLDIAKHQNSMTRATFIARLALEFGTSADDYHLTLDGNGTNRMAMRSVYAHLSLDECPRILTLEMNPVVAFSQKLMFGDEIMFTGANPEFTTKDLIEGRFSSHPKIEHLILKDNPLLTESVKKQVKVLYLDYCGGPIANQTPEKCSTYMLDIINKLPALEIFAVTISRRRHPNLDDDFATYVPVPHGFCLAKTFTDNRLVVCNVYTVLRAEECTSDDPKTHVPVKRSYLCGICQQPKKGHVCKGFQTISKRPYMCSKCGKPKKGHICMVRKSYQK